MTIVDFIENALGLSVAEAILLATNRPGELVARRDSLYGTLETSWAGTTVDMLEPVQEFELRPVYGRGLGSGHGELSSRYGDITARSRIGTEVKTLLLYSHRTVLMNPLLPSLRVSKHAVVTDQPPGGQNFVDAIRAICELGPLIRDGVVLVADPPAAEWKDIPDLQMALAHVAAMLRNKSSRPVDQQNLYQLAVDVLLRFLNFSLLDPQDRAGAFAGRPEAEGNGLSSLVTALAEYLEADPYLRVPAEEARLESLMLLNLPGVDSLGAEDMVAVREDQKFTQFRNDMRVALATASDSLRVDDLKSARRDVTEFMASRATDLRSSGARTRFWSATAGDSVNWIVGASLTALVGWKAALIGLLAKGAFEMARTTKPRAEKALLNHYVAIGGTLLESLPSDPKTRIREWRDKQ